MKKVLFLLFIILCTLSFGRGKSYTKYVQLMQCKGLTPSVEFHEYDRGDLYYRWEMTAKSCKITYNKSNSTTMKNVRLYFAIIDLSGGNYLKHNRNIYNNMLKTDQLWIAEEELLFEYDKKGLRITLDTGPF